MTQNFNVLITSIAKKIPLIDAVRKALKHLSLKSKIFGGDSNSQSIGCYFVDEFWQMPYQNDLTIEILLNFCKKQNINTIIPTRDGELTFFAQHQENLLKNGISCLISPQKTIEICLNKLLFYQFLSKYKFPIIPALTQINAIDTYPPYVVKECFGSGSHSIGLNLSLEDAQSWSKKLKNPIFQPHIKGQEFSIDVYINRHGNPQGSIARIRELIINGESQITTSVKHPKMEALCLKAALQLGIYGHAVFQVIVDLQNNLHIIECNPRFGGASTLSVDMGLLTFDWFFQECLNLPLSNFIRSPHEMKQIRYPQDKVEIL